MHISFLPYLVDPIAKTPLELEATSRTGDIIQEGFLRHGATGREYPIVRGIPRFVDFEKDNYSRSFGYQWRRWPRVQFESGNIGKPMEGHTRTMWERIVAAHDRKLDVQGVVVDVGCGPGRFIDVARTKGAKVIGIDYSAAVEVAQANFAHDPSVCICQADALNLPIRSHSIDGVFTIGVLHHTPAPEQGVREAYRILREDGWFALCVYGKGGYYDFPTVQLWRKCFKLLWPWFRHYPPLIYAYVTCCAFRPIALFVPPLGKAIRIVFPFVKLPDFHWSLLDTFDSVTPSYQSAHESYEVFNWLKRTGFQDIRPSDWGFSAYTGLRGEHGNAH